MAWTFSRLPASPRSSDFISTDRVIATDDQEDPMSPVPTASQMPLWVSRVRPTPKRRRPADQRREVLQQDDRQPGAFARRMNSPHGLRPAPGSTRGSRSGTRSSPARSTPPERRRDPPPGCPRSVPDAGTRETPHRGRRGRRQRTARWRPRTPRSSAPGRPERVQRCGLLPRATATGQKQRLVTESATE